MKHVDVVSTNDSIADTAPVAADDVGGLDGSYRQRSGVQQDSHNFRVRRMGLSQIMTTYTRVWDDNTRSLFNKLYREATGDNTNVDGKHFTNDYFWVSL